MASSPTLSHSSSSSVSSPSSVSLSKSISLPSLSTISASSTTPSSSIKLDRSNYLFWSSMVLSLLRGQRLDGYVLGTKPCPKAFLTGDEVNPQYEEWIAADQTVFGWLLSCMTPEIRSQLVRCSTSHELWKAARDLIGADTRSRILLTKSEFQRIRKNTLRMDEYLARVKHLADQLSLAGSSVSDDELVAITLSGLDLEYNSIVCTLMSRTNLSWIDLQSELLAFECRLELYRGLNNLSLTSPSVHLARADMSAHS